MDLVRRHPRAIAVAAIGLAAAAGIALGAFWFTQDDDPADVPAGTAATVNGVPISEDLVQRGLRHTAAFGRTLTREEYLDVLIGDELLYQAAEEEGLLPSSDEVEQAIALTRSQTNWEEFTVMLERLGEPVPGEDEYWAAPALRDGMRRSLAVDRYRQHLGSTRDGPPELEAVVQAEIERLRAKADIEIFPQ